MLGNDISGERVNARVAGKVLGPNLVISAEPLFRVLRIVQQEERVDYRGPSGIEHLLDAVVVAVGSLAGETPDEVGVRGHVELAESLLHATVCFNADVGPIRD